MRGREIDASLVAESRRGLTVRPLIIDLGRDFRGGQDQALLLLRGLQARGHAPELITIRDSLLARRAKEGGISTHGVSSSWRRLDAARIIRRLVGARRVDVLHANEPHALTSAWLARAHRSIPMIVSRRVELPLSSDALSQARYRATRRVAAVSDFVKESVLASGLPADLVEVIYVGVEVPEPVSQAERDAARRRFAIGPESVCLGNVAALVPEKGHVLLLGALAKLRAQFPQCVVLLAGEGREQSHLQTLARELHLEALVKFTGFVPDVQSVYGATDIFVFPSHQEPLAVAMLSAMAYGLPLVAFARGGNPEAVEDGKNGLLVKELDAVALAAAIARLLANRDEARRLGEAARGTVRIRFSADQMVEGTLRLYRDVTGLP
jgi:glycosyltransferase involved in cell wall biosynthesis